MYLAVSTIESELEQGFILSTEQRVSAVAISLWVYLNDVSDADTFRFKVKRGAEVIATLDKTGAQIKTAIGGINTYSHGKLILDFGTIKMSRGNYSISAQQLTGYTSTKYLGWCRDWESKYLPQDISTSELDSPMFIRIYDYKGANI